MIEVFDDIISKEYQNYILNLINEEDFPLYFRPNIVSYHYGNVNTNINGFTHLLFENQKPQSQYFNTIYPLVLNITEKTKIKFNCLDRMRFNFILQERNSNLQYHMPHIDNYTPHLVAIYYVNDCDGDTFIFDQKLDILSEDRDKEIIENNNWTIKTQISPKKGRLLVFDGRYYHASSYTKNSYYRCVINMNLSII